MRRARHCRFLSPPCTTGTRALRWRRRLLDRAHTVRRCGVGIGGGDGGRSHRTSRAPCASFTRTHTHAHARSCHRRFPSPPRTTGTRALRWRRRSLDREHAVTAAAAAAAAAATDDTRDDGSGDDSPPRPSQARALVSAAPPAEAPPRRPLVFSFLSSRPLSRRARGRVSGTPIIHPSVRMTAHCAHTAHNAPPPPARARERAKPRPPGGDIATRRHDDAAGRRPQPQCRASQNRRTRTRTRMTRA
jgi:hypothetical protein